MGILLLRPQQVVTGETKDILGTKYSTKTDYLHRALKDKGIVDSGCSRHMTGNKAHPADYQEFKGGFIAFRGSNGRIICKGKIKAGRSWVASRFSNLALGVEHNYMVFHIVDGVRASNVEMIC
uniref:Uncharacterized protein n=1 Tax=Tanacetum cinerariifolium TaxID=118510 RepID=A0A699JMT6_TANCI|nr:hypothetical protein [Tanacetum cinerariifolium]